MFICSISVQQHLSFQCLARPSKVKMLTKTASNLIIEHKLPLQIILYVLNELVFAACSGLCIQEISTLPHDLFKLVMQSLLVVNAFIRLGCSW